MLPARKVELDSSTPDQIDLIRIAYSSTGATPIDWDDPYEPGNVVATRLEPGTRRIVHFSRPIYLALAFNIPILDCSWLIQSYCKGEWLSTEQYSALIANFNNKLFDGTILAVSVPGLRGEDIMAMAVALGAELFCDNEDIEKIQPEIERFIYVTRSKAHSSAWGIVSGSWEANTKCCELMISTTVQDESWFYTCVRSMKII